MGVQQYSGIMEDYCDSCSNRSMDRLGAMQAFVTVAEHRSFTAAAKKLGASATAVTRLVAGLEQRLATRLLHRTTRKVALTDAGARYLELARRIVADVDEAERAVRAEQVAPTGRFVVTAPATFGRLEVAPLVCEMLARHAAVQAELVLADRVVDLLDEGIDVAIRIGQLADSSLARRVVGSTRRILVASPAYLAVARRIRSPADLEGHPLIQFTSLTPLPQWEFARGDREHRLAIRPRLVTNSADAAIGHALRGGGLAMVLSYQARDALASGALVTVLERYEPERQPIQLVHSASRIPSANLRAFVELVIARDWSF